MIIIYTGDGKGKTSACAGQALRAIGHGMGVVFAQFIKRDLAAGEQVMLKKLLGENFRAGGLGFFRNEMERQAHREAALNLLAWASARDCQMLILDESLYALDSRLILQDELEAVVEIYHKSEKILVLSGRGLPEWLVPYGDIITTMELVKHAFKSGIHAAKGVEY